MNFIIYFAVLVPLVLIDGLWLFAMGGNYKKWLGHLFAPTVSLMPVIFFYLFYALGITFFIVMPFIRGMELNSVFANFNAESIKNAVLTFSDIYRIFLAGAFLGLIAYGAYDLTNQATLKDWPFMVTAIDMLWGGIVTGVSSVVAVILVKTFLK